MNLPKKEWNQLWPVVGFLLWLSFLAFKKPDSAFTLDYIQFLILAVPLWLFPISLKILKFKLHRFDFLMGSCAAFSLMTAFLVQDVGIYAAVWSVPWLLFTVYLMALKFGQHLLISKKQMKDYCELAAFVYLPVGAAWAFADRLDFQPMGFDSTIVLLTVAHFHYAGFVLPIITSQILQKVHSRFKRFLAIGVIAGVPLVATGITTTHFDFPMAIEIACVSIMAPSALGIGLLHLKYGLEKKGMLGALFIIAGLALSIGMLLALLYGWRTVYPIEAINIPFMYVFHGTLNAVGFAVPALLGWRALCLQ